MQLTKIKKLFSKKYDSDKIKTCKFNLQKNVVITAKSLNQKTLWNIDLINNQRFDESSSFEIDAKKPIQLYGWAIDSIEEKPAGEVFVELNGKLFKAKKNIERIDVSNAYHNPAYKKSGFLANLPSKNILQKNNQIRLYILTTDKKYYYETKAKTFYAIKKQQKVKQVATPCKKLGYSPKFSIITPVYNPELNELKECINSVINQTYSNWELCITDDHSSKKDVLKFLRTLNHPNIKVTFLSKNKGISQASNESIKSSTGEYICFLDNDDLLDQNALYEVAKVLNKDKSIDIIYTDETKIDELGNRFDDFYKPDYSPETLLSMNYICHFTTYRKKIIEDVGLLRKEYDGSQDYDLILRAIQKTDKIMHIPEVLYYWRAGKKSTAKTHKAKPYALIAAKNALMDYLKQNNIEGKVTNISPVGKWKIKYTLTKNPSVSIIIPAGPKLKLLKKCISSILKKTSYPNYKITVIDNSHSIRTKDYLEELKSLYPSKVDYFTDKTKPFNFSKINNTAVQKVKSDYLIFLNDDTEIITINWIEEMLQEAIKPTTGIVGAMLLYPNNTIQHAGVVVGICGAADHVFRGFDPSSDGYFGFHKITRNISAVTFACAMVSRDKFLQVGGLDETDFKVGLNDVDFCLKLQKKGFRNIYTPHAKLYHYESASRGVETIQNPRFRKEIKLFNKKWKNVIEDDPYYNPNLTKTNNDYRTNTNKKNNNFYTLLKGIILSATGLIIALI